MKNYYKILQVDKDASPEIIKVAYKLLVKKYHPDLKEGDSKIQAEEKIKEINEAYEVLYDKQKRSQYDQSIYSESISPEQYQLIVNENKNLRNELNYYKRTYNTNNYNQPPYTNMYANNHVNSNYYSKQSSSSNDNLKNNLFNLEFLKKQFNEKIKSIIALIITFFILFIIYQLPFIKNILPDFIRGEFFVALIFLIIGYYYFFKNKS